MLEEISILIWWMKSLLRVSYNTIKNYLQLMELHLVSKLFNFYRRFMSIQEINLVFL